MLRVAIRHVDPDHVDNLREWLDTVNGSRREEALQTLVEEGCRQEQAYLIHGPGATMIVYVMDVEDVEKAKQVGAASTHPIDADHKRIMSRAITGDVSSELLLDLFFDENG